MKQIEKIFRYLEKIVSGLLFWFFLFLIYFILKEYTNIKFNDINFIDILNIFLALTLSIYIPIAIWKSLEIKKDKKTLFINEIESYENSIHELVRLIIINDENLSFDNKKELILLQLIKIWNNKKLIKDMLAKYFLGKKIDFEKSESCFHEIYWHITENFARPSFIDFNGDFNRQMTDLSSKKISSLLDIKFDIIEH